MPDKAPNQPKAASCNAAPAPKNTCGTKQIPELVKIEVANVEGEIILVQSEPKDGSAIEAASELYKLTELLTEKAEELKAKADQAFLGTSDGETLAHATSKSGIEAGCKNDKVLPSAVQEMVDEVCAEIRVVKPQSEVAVQNAAALDQVAEILENKAASVKDKKIALTAHELNSLDGFDR
jgi:hypothetical protein